MAGLSDFDLAAFVSASCERCGVAVKITDPLVHGRVAVLLSGRAARGAAERDPGWRAGSQSPDKIHAVGVEPSTTLRGRGDDGVVEDGFDNGVLPGEVEFGPLAS